VVATELKNVEVFSASIPLPEFKKENLKSKVFHKGVQLL